MKTNAGFDFLAPIYDSLARLVFRGSMVDSQTYFLNQLPSNAKVLILGGGTGWILEALAKQNSTSMVWYIDASSKMIEKARQRKISNQVSFICGTEADIPSQIQFDVIIANFFLDLFSENKVEKIIRDLTDKSNDSATWLITDFVSANKWWHRFMLKIMYWFFRRVCNIEATRLPDWSKQLTDQHWIEKNSKLWYSGFIKSSTWLRPLQNTDI